MWLIATIVAALVLILALGQLLFVVAFLRVLRRRELRNPDYEPKVAVILSLRGPDPAVSTTLSGLLEQNYRDYTLHVIVDSAGDSVWEDVRSIQGQAEPGRVVAQVLDSPRPTCSLKCSALIQAIESLEDDVEVVAFLDGDAPPHREWLRQLVDPLADSSVGVSTGNRWYVPVAGDWGGLIRYLWNVGAVVQVWLNGIVWAGSMAMRVDVIEQLGLLNAWKTALSVDGTMFRLMHESKRRVHFAPQVIMFNHERISLSQFHRWVQRQLIAAKSCGPGWRLVLVHALNLVFTQAAVLSMIIAAAVSSETGIVLLCTSLWALYWVTAAASVIMLDREMQHIGRENGVRQPGQSAWMWRCLLPGLALTHLVYPFSLLSAYGRNRVSWRGIEYEILGAGKVRMLEYRPFHDTREREAESVI